MDDELAMMFFRMALEDPVRLKRLADEQLAKERSSPSEEAASPHRFAETNAALRCEWKKYLSEGPLAPHPAPEMARALGSPRAIVSKLKKYCAQGGKIRLGSTVH